MLNKMKYALAICFVTSSLVGNSWNDVTKEIYAIWQAECGTNNAAKSSIDMQFDTLVKRTLSDEEIHQLFSEIKLFSHAVLKFGFESEEVIHGFYNELYQALNDGTLKTFDQLVSIIERHSKIIISDAERVLSHELQAVKMLKFVIDEMRSSIKKKNNFFARLHAIKPLALDADMLAEVKKKWSEYSISHDKMTELKNLLDGEVDYVVNQLETIYKDPQFRKALAQKKPDEKLAYESAELTNLGFFCLILFCKAALIFKD